MSDLSSFLEVIRRSPGDDTVRLVFADWLDEHYPATPVRPGVLPKGFNAYWHHQLLGYEFKLHFGYERPGGGRKWGNGDILRAFATVLSSTWAAHAVEIDATEVGGFPVLVIELRADDATALRLCAAMQPGSGGCPVSFSRQAAVGASAVRICIWYTALPDRMTLLQEAVNRLPSLTLPARPQAMQSELSQPTT